VIKATLTPYVYVVGIAGGVSTAETVTVNDPSVAINLELAITEDGSSCPWSETQVNTTWTVTSFEASLSASPDTSTTPVYFDASNHEIRIATTDEAHVGGPYTYSFTADFANWNGDLVGSVVYTMTLNIDTAVVVVVPTVDPATTPSEEAE
jgi:hypothetical protein